MPYDTFRMADPLSAGGSLHRRVPRPGFGYPPRDLLRHPYRRLRTGASLSFTLQGFLLYSDGYPSRGPCPLGVTNRPPHDLRGERALVPGGTRHLRKRRCAGRGRLQGLVPAASSCCRRDRKRSRPSIPSWVSALQSIPPTDQALALSTAPPLSPLDGLTSLSVRVPGSRDTAEWIDPFPDRQLSWGFRPCDDRGAPFAAPGGGLMVSPHTTTRENAGPRDPSPSFCDAAADPGPAARHRRPSVYDR
jgi:hypothetical protein